METYAGPHQEQQQDGQDFLVGKYVKLHDSYLSIVESLHHAGWEMARRWRSTGDSETITPETAPEILGDSTGIIVPGGFGIRGIEGA